MFDYHIHTQFSGDSDTAAQKMIEAAIAKNMTEIAITDHFDPGYTDPSISFELDMGAYSDMLETMQKRYQKQITIKKGIELGLQMSELAACQKAAAALPFDFIIASFHMSNGKLLHVPEYFKEREGKAIHLDFYTDLYRTLQAFKQYSVVGHLNIIDRYVYLYCYQMELNPAYAMDIVREILRMLIYEGKGLEVNASSYRYGLPILTPSQEILKAYLELGGEILTVGSDAHSPEYIGDHFEILYPLLQSMGFRYLCAFDQMKPSFHTIESIIPD